MSAHLITSTRLEKLLGLGDGVLDYWRSHDFLKPAAIIQGQRHYSVPELDALFAERACNWPNPPTVAALLKREVVLLSSEEAAARLGVSADAVWELIRRRKDPRNRLPAIRLLHEYRIPAASVEARKTAKDPEANVPRPAVERVLGVSRPIINRLMREGRLTDAGTHYSRRITRDSLLRLLGELLPEWIDPRDWLEDRLLSEKPLMPVIAVAGTRPRKPHVRALLQERKLRYINVPFAGMGRRQLIDPNSVLAYLIGTEQPLTRTRIAHVFGVSHQGLRNWVQAYPELLDCPLHDHDEDDLYRPCLLAILSRYLSPNMPPSKWYTARMRGSKLVDVAQAASLLGVPDAAVVAMAEDGQLNGLRSPAGRWRFLHATVIRKRKQRSLEP